MKASEAKLLSFLQTPPQFVIPIYQHVSTGDVDAGLSPLDVLPYVLGLVRHHCEGQMGDGAQA